ncbi:MOSC domain-containing protein [Luteitalea sp.]|uniref:MOSC domain-containing protein n=1 Tax=Luteitalea sp. TaxID=2004800 RepID=UPI0037CA59D7
MTDGLASSGRVEALWTKRAHRGPMDDARELTLVEGKGVLGSADRSRTRQVTIISDERWARVEATLGWLPDPSVRRANVLVRGVTLALRRGDVLCLGEARVRIKGETRPCERMDEAAAGLRLALGADLGGGLYGEVLTGGVVRVGDPVRWEAPEPPTVPLKD